MKATIKSIPITEVNEGMQVLYNNNLVLTVVGDGVKKADCISKFFAVGIYYQLKTIVVEYVGNDFGKHLVKQLPLKQSDWQQAIDLGLVDSGKEVEVEIVTIAGKGHGSKDVFAQLVPQQKRDYTDIVELGVGDGTGQLFVKGSYDAIKTLQSKLLELEQLKVKLKNQSNNETDSN